MQDLTLLYRSVVGVLFITLISACAGDKSNIVYDTFKLGFSNPNTVIDETPLNPNYRYLKVEVNNRPALLVLGYEDNKKNHGRAIWYSAFKEVIQIEGGRLAGSEGLDTNWTQVKLQNPPPFSKVLVKPNIRRAYQPKYRYVRIRTVMPGYQVNIRETVVMQALDSIPSDAPKELKDEKVNRDIRWVEETVLVPSQSKNPSITPLRAIYAIDSKTEQVIYGKQYLTPNDFISWLTWPYPKKISPFHQKVSKLDLSKAANQAPFAMNVASPLALPLNISASLSIASTGNQ
jgi:hypothetical protein